MLQASRSAFVLGSLPSYRIGSLVSFPQVLRVRCDISTVRSPHLETPRGVLPSQNPGLAASVMPLSTPLSSEPQHLVRTVPFC